MKFRDRNYQQTLVIPLELSPFSYIKENALSTATKNVLKFKQECLVGMKIAQWILFNAHDNSRASSECDQRFTSRGEHDGWFFIGGCLLIL